MSKMCLIIVKYIIQFIQIVENKLQKYGNTCYNTIDKDITTHMTIHKKEDKIGVVKMDRELSIFDVANWFLQKEDMCQKKLQKLCYYAQAWHYALRDNSLFCGEFEAWVHGPVNRQLWYKLKEYGYLDITKKEFESQAFPICKNEVAFLERVWATYGSLNGDQLEDLTHKELPWQEARKGIPESQISTNQICSTTMKKYYSSIYSGDGCGE